MGDSKVNRAELHDLAGQVGRVMAEFDGRLHSLALAFDCLAAVLDGRFADDGDKSPISNAVKAELERRKKEAEAAKAP